MLEYTISRWLKIQREYYFQQLKETSNLVTPLILKYLKESKIDYPALHFVEKITLKRADKPRQRDMVLRLSYEISDGKDWKKIIPNYAAAIELLNNSTYIINWYLDGKGDLKTELDNKNVINAGFLLRELSQEIIEKQNIEDKIKLEIINLISDTNYKIYQGQNLDLNILTIDNYEQFKDKDKFFSLSDKKAKLVCGYFYDNITKIGSLLANNSKYQKELSQFAINLTKGLQLINESGDFLPMTTVEKDYKDQMTDLKNGRLTIPIWCVLKYGNNKQKDLFLEIYKEKNISNKDYNNIILTLKESGAFDFCIKKSLNILKENEKIIHQLPKSESRDLLSIMNSIMKTNKFYNKIKELIEYS